MSKLFEDMKKRIRCFECNSGLDIIDYSLHDTPRDLISTIDDLKFQTELLLNDLIEMLKENDR